MSEPMHATHFGPAAAAAWRLMFDFLMRSAPQRMESLRMRGLTPNDARALFSLPQGEGTPIGTLAREWGLDPSTATWVVDRLVASGLCERISSATDRRVKLIKMTAKGGDIRAELLEEYYRPPTEIARLTVKDLDKLLDLMQKLTRP